MTSPAGPAPRPPFLAVVGEAERNPWRLGLWLLIGVPLALFAMAVVVMGAVALDPSLLDLIGREGNLAGPHRLLGECRYLGLVAFGNLAGVLALVGAASVAFRRPAWTFVSPVRPFAPGLLAVGVGVYGLLAGASLGLDLLQGAKIVPPVLDSSQPEIERVVYALACTPLILTAAAAEEILFRGVVLQASSAFIKTRTGLCVTNGLLFALMHADPNPLNFLALAMMGAVFAYSVLELGGLEFSLGAHFANNAVILLLQEPLSAAAKSPPFHLDDLAKPDTWASLAEQGAVSLLTLAAVMAIRRRRPSLS